MKHHVELLNIGSVSPRGSESYETGKINGARAERAIGSDISILYSN